MFKFGSKNNFTKQADNQSVVNPICGGQEITGGIFGARFGQSCSPKVEFNNSRSLYTDYFTLMKTNEGWFIADKVSTRTPHRIVEISVEKK